MYLLKILMSFISVLVVSAIISFFTMTILDIGARFYFDAFEVDGPGIGISLSLFWLGNVLVFTYVGLRIVIPKLK